MEATLHTFVTKLADAPDAPLRFVAENETIRPDYHVTEIRTARVRSLDCGQRHAAWNETIVELLDGPETPPSQAAYMTAGTFTRIASHGKEILPNAGSARLYFEYGPGNGPMRKHEIRDLRFDDSGWIVDLVPVRAACKPALDAMATADFAAKIRQGSAMAADRSKTGCC